MLRVTLITLLVFASTLYGQTRYGLKYDLYAQDGTYLGHTGNRFEPGSVYNRFGEFGSRYSTTSIWNKRGPHGSRYSPLSWRNPRSLQSPIITQNYTYFGRLGGNQLLPNHRSLQELDNPFLIPPYSHIHTHTRNTTINQKKTATHPHSLIQQYQNAKTLKEKQKIWNDMFNTP